MNELINLSSTEIQTAFRDLNLIRQQNPIVHNITNLVVMQTTANILLAIGASPIMAHAKEELAEIVSISNALVINIGTLDEAWLHSIEFAQHEALKRSIPIILDPVGAGASQYRTYAAHKILNTGVQILRGNSSEIMALVDSKIKTNGVDASHQSNEAIDAARIVSNQYQCVVVVSGETDIIVDQNKQIFIPYGTSLFTKVVGIGCSATAVIAAFAAINKDYFSAATHAMTIYAMAGQLAALESQGPALFYNKLIDTLFSFKKEDINRKVLS